MYLALQSTMVGVEQTKSLILLYVTIAGLVGAVLMTATTIIGFALEDKLFGTGNTGIRGKGMLWWGALFIVCLVCECLARLKYMKFFGEKRTKREYCWYASSHAIELVFLVFTNWYLSHCCIYIISSKSS